MQRPAWPYVLGAVGGVILAIGACAFLYAAFAEPTTSTAADVVSFGFGTGGLVVGIGWIGVFKQRQAGIGPILGSFVITLAVIYARVGADKENLDLVAVLVLLSFVLFGLGHAVTRGIGGARVLGGIAATGAMFQIMAVSAHWKIDKGIMQFVDIVSVGSLALLGLVLVIAMPALRRAPIDDTAL